MKGKSLKKLFILSFDFSHIFNQIEINEGTVYQQLVYSEIGMNDPIDTHDFSSYSNY